MKILISCITYHPTVGGADDFIRSIAEGLAELGHDVMVVASDLEQHVAGTKLEDTTEKTLNGVRVVRCRSFNLPGHIYPVWPGLFRRIKLFKPDIIHGFGLGYWSADAAALLRGKMPVVISPTGGRYRSGRLYGALRALLLSRTVRVDLWTALSADEHRSLVEAHPAVARIERLSPSIVPLEWERKHDDPFPLIPREHRVFFAGRLSRDKGVFDLIDAMTQVRKTVSAQLIIAGPDYGIDASRIGAPGISRLKNDAEAVNFAGALSREKLVAAYQHTDLLVLPSYHEGFGIVLLEAMAAGKPVIAYDNSSMPELAVHEQNGLLVRTGDIEGLASAITTILTDPDRAARYGERGRARATSEFSREAMIDHVIGLYKSAMGRH